MGAVAGERRRFAYVTGIFLALLVLAATAASPASALDPVPQPSYTTDGLVSSLARAGNTLYLGGSFTRLGERTGPGVAIDAGTGQADGSMPAVSGGTGNVYAVVSDGSGGWYIGGYFTHVGGVARSNIAHIRADKTVDPAFAPNPDDQIRALAVEGSTVYAGGLFTSIGGQQRNNLAALDATTGAATAWAPQSGAVFTLAATSSRVVVNGPGLVGA